MDCIFCKIIAGEIPSTKIYEDEKVYVFEDINPVAPVHILVVPKKHTTDLNELSREDESLLGHMILTAQKLAAEKGMAGGYRLVLNSGVSAGQSVFHLHLHLLAGRQFGWPPG
jgi:histidine triad (HIT) family protein